MIDFTLSGRTRTARAVDSRVGRPRSGAVHPRERPQASFRSRTDSRRDGEARTAGDLGPAGVRRRGNGLHRPRHRQRGARVPRHVAARDHVGPRRAELPVAALLGQRRSEAAVSGAAGAGQEDRRLRPDRTRRRQRRARDPDDGDRRRATGTSSTARRAGSRSPTSPITSWSSPGPISRRRRRAIRPA